MKEEKTIRLKEILVGVMEGHCEREPGESDEDFLTRCGNSMWDRFGSIQQLSNIPLAMKKQIVVPTPIKPN
jgi:hypothetical protein